MYIYVYVYAKLRVNKYADRVVAHILLNLIKYFNFSPNSNENIYLKGCIETFTEYLRVRLLAFEDLF